jgi:aerobic-type carbon monoxide dehydrogenase small subunit (CoxS/CutS family)
MVIAAEALLRSTPHPTDEQVVAAMQSHICRCGVYAPILRAIHLAAERMNQ